MMLFAMVFEREPARWSQFPEAFCLWLQNAGAVAAFGVALYLAARYLTREAQALPLLNLSARWAPLFTVLRIFAAAAAIGYAFLVLCWLGDLLKIGGMKRLLPRGSTDQPFTIGDWLLTVCGALALIVALTPIVVDLVTRISLRRIWAIAGLSWKEAVRGRVFWIFGAIALVFLFAGWFVHGKDEHQLRNYISIVYISMMVLFLITAGLLGSFSIPNDVKNNSIHTIVTKPVEKFEIVLGRFLGYGALLTIGLFVVSSLSLLYVVRGVNEEARKESYRARVPIYGKLHFSGTKSSSQGDNVGREWAYRSYIGGASNRQRDAQRQYAIWDIEGVPADVTGRAEPTVFEFSFDVFRLSKGEEEGKGVFCTFTFTDGTIGPERLQTEANKLKAERDKRVVETTKDIEVFLKTLATIDRDTKADDPARAAKIQGAADVLRQKRDARFGDAIAEIGAKIAKAPNEAERQKLLTFISDETVNALERSLAAEFRLYLKRGIEVTDYHTQEFVVPPGVLEALRPKAGQNADPREPALPALRVFVSVDQTAQAQMVGVAQMDFYLVAHEMPFWQNFLKGVIGMWCTFMLVLGVAIACSTYLSSVISLLAAMFLFLTGMFVEYLREIADMKVDGGGPMESFLRIANQMPIAAKLESSPTKTLVDFTDNLFSWWIGRLLRLIPDVNRHDLHQYVANGFDIGWFDVLLLDNFLPLAAYLAPWAIVAYYLMKYREIANPQ